MFSSFAMALTAVGCDCGSTAVHDAPPHDAFRARPDVVSIEDDARGIESDAPIDGTEEPMRCRVEPADAFLLGSDGDVEMPERTVDVAGSEREFVVVWRERIGTFPQIRGVRIGSRAGAPTVMTLTRGETVHDGPAIAAVVGGYVVAWSDNAAGGFRDVRGTAQPSGLGDVQQLTSRDGRDDCPVLVGGLQRGLPRRLRGRLPFVPRGRSGGRASTRPSGRWRARRARAEPLEHFRRFGARRSRHVAHRRRRAPPRRVGRCAERSRRRARGAHPLRLSAALARCARRRVPTLSSSRECSKALNDTSDLRLRARRPSRR